MQIRRIACFVGLTAVALALCYQTSEAKIQAVKGKRYLITKRHGPWMILVASFRDVPQTKFEIQGEKRILVQNERYKSGKSALQAADELVHELRRKGIPAYTYKQDPKVGRIESVDRRGRTERKVYKAQEDRICVFAGNYSGVNDKVAQKTLSYVKRLHPRAVKGGGVFHKTPGRAGPLASAFLTINPQLTSEEAKRRQKNHDPLLLKLNSGADYNLTQNKGKYSLLVKTFYGKSTSGRHVGAAKKIKVSDKLAEAAEDAWLLTQVFRELHGIEAYVYHDRYTSIVTVGSFDNPNDSRMVALAKHLGGKIQRHPETGKTFLGAEAISLPGRKTWFLDPNPKPIKTPRL